MSGSRWVSRHLGYLVIKIFLYSSCVYFCHLFLISSTSIKSIAFLSFIVTIFGTLGTSNFLKEISSLSHSIVSLYFFAVITEEDFLIFPWHSLELCIQTDISFLSLLFSQLSVRLPQTTILPLCILFLGRWFNHHFLYSIMNLHP